ncbi:MAG: LacI family DNA-binding transcriptional regulator [Roseiarcus sp.]|jgi:LacI family transcriptional regulator
MAKIVDVARRAGVSVGSVSRVINEHPSVSPATRERVEIAVRELGYVPNAIAGSLRSRRSKTIGLIIPDVTNPFFSELALHVERSAAAAGYNVILGNSDNSAERQKHYLRALAVRRVDGIILAPARGIDPSFEFEIPLVGVDREVAGRQFVASDNRAGAKSATEYLLRLGHRFIACVAGPKDLPNAQERRMGYEDVALPILRSAGVDPSAYIVSAHFSYDSGYAAIRRLMDVAPRPTAIFASSDQQAIGALRAAADLGLAVPGDLSIVGFDDIPLANLVMPRLTTVGQPVAKIGVLAMQLLLDLLSGGSVPRRRRHLLATSLQIRQSCAPPNASGAVSVGRMQEASLQPA